jgi:hypothetical protein
MPVTITARCHPALEPILPKPIPAAKALPDWLKAMPATAVSETLSGGEVRTLKQCPPVLDAYALGLILPLACDITVAGGEIGWDWEPPVLPDHSASRAPIGMHAPEQATGAPFQPDWLFIKFTNFWTLETPPGWQILFTHPFNRPDLPFQTLTGLVDCDRFGKGYVHFPARWLDPDWEGTIPRGTPVAQAIPIPRETVDLDARTMTEREAAATEEIQQALHAGTGVYRKQFRLRAGRDG